MKPKSERDRELIGRDCDECGAELPPEKWRQCAACAEKAETERDGLRDELRKKINQLPIYPYHTWDGGKSTIEPQNLVGKEDVLDALAALPHDKKEDAPG
jgi:hypothetical protein